MSRVRKLALRDNAALPAVKFHDDFTIDRAATLATPFPADRQGLWTGVSSPTTCSISSGKLNLVGGGINLSTGNIARKIGRATVGVMRRTGGTYIAIGLGSPTVGFSDNSSFLINGLLNHVSPMSNNNDYQMFSVLRSQGQFVLVRGGIYTKLTLLWVDENTTTAQQGVNAGGFDGVGTIDYVKVVDFGDVWHDYCFLTERLVGARAANDTIRHQPDCLLYFTVTTRPSSGNLDFHFRKQDASNYWLVRINSSGDIALFEVVAGVETQRSATASGVIANGDRVGIICDTTSIRVMEGATGGLSDSRILYSSASNFATATTAVLASLGTGGAVSEMQSWLRFIEERTAPQALAIANRIVPFP